MTGVFYSTFFSTVVVHHAQPHTDTHTHKYKHTQPTRVGCVCLCMCLCVSMCVCFQSLPHSVFLLYYFSSPAICAPECFPLSLFFSPNTLLPLFILSPCMSVSLLMRGRFDRIHNSYASTVDLSSNALSIDLPQQSTCKLTHTRTHVHNHTHTKKHTHTKILHIRNKKYFLCVIELHVLPYLLQFFHEELCL